MYLALLNEKEKELFLGVAFNLVAADGNYSDEEKAMMNGYCQEMQYILDEKIIDKPIDTLIKDINSKSDIKIKKIIIFELIGLAMADGNYGDNERKLMNKLEIEFGIDKVYAKNCEVKLNKYIAFQTELNQFVLG